LQRRDGSAATTLPSIRRPQQQPQQAAAAAEQRQQWLDRKTKCSGSLKEKRHIGGEMQETKAFIQNIEKLNERARNFECGWSGINPL
jgi:hypothetical protein